MDIPEPPNVWPPAPTLPPPEKKIPKPFWSKAWLSELLVRSIIIYGFAMLGRYVVGPHIPMTWRAILVTSATVVIISAFSIWLDAIRRRNKMRL